MLPRKAQHISTKEIDGQTMVLDRQNGKLHELNSTASFIWQSCDGHTSVKDIVAATARAFDRDPSSVEHDVTTTLREFERLQLIDWATP
jgi:hypothetical protein